MRGRLAGLAFHKRSASSIIRSAVVALRKKINVPTDLAISLLEKKINEGTGGGNKWVLVHGFATGHRV